jgi:hypothetical protein
VLHAPADSRFGAHETRKFFFGLAMMMVEGQKGEMMSDG